MSCATLFHFILRRGERIMNEADTINNTDRIFLDFSARKLELLAGRIESCLDRLSAEQIWTRGGASPDAGCPLRLARRQTEDALHIARGVENPDDLERLSFMPVYDQVRIDQKESVTFAGQLLAPVADTGILCQSDHGALQ